MAFEHTGMATVQRYPYRMGIAMGLLVTFVAIVILGFDRLFGLFLGGSIGIGTALVLAPRRRPPADDGTSEPL